MGLLSDLLLFPIAGPLRGVRFIAERIKDQVDEEQLTSSETIKDELMNLAIRHELGDVSDEAFAEQESALLERLDTLRYEQEAWQGAEEAEGDIYEAADEFDADAYIQDDDGT